MADQPFSPDRMHGTQRPQIYALTIVFTALAFTSVCLRLYTRHRITRYMGADDIAIVIAQILSFGVSVTTIVQLAIGGLGRHTEFASRNELFAGLRVPMLHNNHELQSSEEYTGHVLQPPDL